VNALGVATRGGHEKIVDLLLDHDAYVAKDEIYDGIINPLHVAIVLSRDDMLKVLLRRGFHPNCRNRFTHWTPTMTTAIAGEICTARILFKHDADALLSNTAGQSANQIAKKCNHEELASFIQRKANQNLSNSGDNKDNIIQAVKHGDENLVRKLLDQDSARANSHTKEAATPLMYASMAGSMALVEILLEYGADINAKDFDNGWTALMQATYYDQTEIAKYLIKRGANVNLRAKNGVTALDMAMLINLNDTELFRMLANRSIESADLSKIAEEEQRHQLPKSESGFFRKISKSLKNKAWYKSVTDLNGTMVAKTETLPNKRESVFSPLHTVVKRCDDLPDLSPPEFTRSIRVRAVKDAQTPKSKAKQKMKRTVNTKILLDNSTNSSRSSSGSGGQSTFNELRRFNKSDSVRSKSSSRISSSSSRTSSTITPTQQSLDLDEDVRSVLEELSLTPKYKKIFAEQEIDIQVFQSLSTCDLKELGITQPNIRQKLLQAIDQIKGEHVT